MILLCKLGFHKWKYKGWSYLFDFSKHWTRYCERCEKIEETTEIIGSIFPPVWRKKVIHNNSEVTE